MRLSAYPRYKPSGVEWLGEVPEHWEKEPLKYATNFVNGMAFKPETWATGGTPIIRIENLNGGEKFNYFDGDVAAECHVRKGDLLFGWSGNRGTSFGPFLWWCSGIHYLNQHIFKLTKYTCDKSWFYWCLKAVTRTIEDEAHGIIGMVHVTRGKLGAIAIPRIPLQEQRAIAEFLDRETAKIDTLVAKKRTLIERLKEKRTALISRTVTRGLRPDAACQAGLDPHPKLKPSGVEWLGEVPAHWEVKPLKHGVRFLEGPGIMASDFVDDGIPLLRIAGLSGPTVTLNGCNYLSPERVADTWEHFRVRRGDLLISGSASTGFCSEVDVVAEGAVPYTGIIIIRPIEKTTKKTFIRWFFLSRIFLIQAELERSGSTIQHFGPSHLARMTLTVPPLPEQDAITDFLDLETTKTDTMVAKVETAIERLQEYRKALITAAVTGKIDVREVAE